MLSFYLCVSLILSPVTDIYLGELVPPISALKLKSEELAPYEGAFLKPADWIAIKTALEGTVSICEWAVSEAVNVSMSQCDELRKNDGLNIVDLNKTITAYETRISELNDTIELRDNEISLYRWVTVGSGALVLSSIIFLWVQK